MRQLSKLMDLKGLIAIPLKNIIQAIKLAMFTKAHIEKIQNMADLMTQIQKQIPEASNPLTSLSLTKGSISQDLTADSLAEAIPSSAL